MTRRIELRVNRVAGHLNDLLHETFPEKSETYEVVAKEVDQYVNSTLGPGPIKVSSKRKPTYEFYLKPHSADGPLSRVMILHGNDLRERVKGGIQEERYHYCVNSFKHSLQTSINELESN